jgi:hypothetical protein
MHRTGLLAARCRLGFILGFSFSLCFISCFSLSLSFCLIFSFILILSFSPILSNRRPSPAISVGSIIDAPALRPLRARCVSALRARQIKPRRFFS